MKLRATRLFVEPQPRSDAHMFMLANVALTKVQANASRLGVRIVRADDYTAERDRPRPDRPRMPPQAGLAFRMDEIAEALGSEGWTRAFGMYTLTRAGMRKPGVPEVRRVAWRIMRHPTIGASCPSFPEIARACGAGSHSTIITSVQKDVHRSQVPAWADRLWELAERLGLTVDDRIPGLAKEVVA